MAFSRNSMVAAVAGTLSLAMLTGCPSPVAPGTGSSASPSSAPTGAPGSVGPTGATGSTGPTGSAAPSTTPASGAPTSVPSSSNNGNRSFKGSVTDEQGAPVDGATVTVTSQNPSTPFTTTVPVTGGRYLVANAPADTLLQVVVTKPSYSPRTQVFSVASSTTSSAQVLNFGKDLDVSTDASGNAYFITDYPEITTVAPADQTNGVDPTKVNIVLTLSEPLDNDSRNRLVRALRLLPSNAAADPTAGTAPTDASTGSDSQSAGSFATVGTTTTGVTVPASTTNFGFGADYAIQSGSNFVNQDNVASVTWNSDFTQATLSFNAPLITKSTATANYQVVLVSQDTTTMKDADGKTLGSKTHGGPGIAYTTNDLVLDAFRNKNLSLDSNSSTQALRWANTHKNNSNFSVAQDSTSPTVTGVTIQSPNSNPKLLVTYSKPMVAYGKNLSTRAFPSNTNLNVYDNGALDVTQYTFRLGKQASNLSDTFDSTVASTTINEWNNVGNTTSSQATWRFNGGTLGSSSTTGFYADVLSTDPKTVRIQAFSQSAAGALPVDSHAIKVRVGAGVNDVAGNTVNTSNNTNFQVGTF